MKVKRTTSHNNKKAVKEINYMAHEIEANDSVYSNSGVEWHGLAKFHEEITEEVVTPILFDIIESPCMVEVDGNKIELEGYKALCADYRNVRPEMESPIVPLHIPRSSYNPIPNRDVWNMMNTALKDIGASVTSAGTLQGGKVFFISTNIGDSDMVINKDDFKMYLNFITSHNGTLAFNVQDSAHRIICQNTLRLSMQCAGDVGFKVYHTKNSDLAIKNLPELLTAILKGRIELKEVLEFLATVKIDNNDAIAYATGYFAEKIGSIEISSRSMNQANAIAGLFNTGIGCRSESLYCLFNAVTQYFTSGEGVGKKNTDIGSRLYKSEFGTASEHKQEFLSMLASDNRRSNALQLGREAIKLASMAN